MVDESGGARRYPIHPPYMGAIRETIARGDAEEIGALLDGARALKSEYGDLPSLIARLEEASRKAS